MEAKNIKAGQIWKTRDGNDVTVTYIYEIEGIEFPVHGSDGCSRTISGMYLNDGSESGFDLVELVEDRTPAPNPETSAGDEWSQRAEHIAGLIKCGMAERMDIATVREFINLYDSAVDGTN